jgi:hypothetical protein
MGAQDARIRQEPSDHAVVHPGVRVRGELIEHDEERKRPQVLGHRDERAVVDDLGDDGDNEHRDDAKHGRRDREQVRLESVEAEVAQREREVRARWVDRDAEDEAAAVCVSRVRTAR